MNPVGAPRAWLDGAERAAPKRYRPLFVIGRGGMGTVEVAVERSADGSERLVALKRLLEGAVRDARRDEMFVREARLAALLGHPNIVQALAFGEVRGELFLAMEYVEGVSLSRVVTVTAERGRSLPAALVAHVMGEVCEGLHAAHELRDEQGNALNVVHRDVSPHNVMIGFDGRVKILDFGVAKFEASTGARTRTGEVKGKMAYMSPEQALGESIDCRSDLFSVGAVLFECVVGAPMWGAGTDLDVLRKLALLQPPRLDQAAADAPRELVELHARLVARDPTGRPQTARQAAEAFRAFSEARLGRPGTDALHEWMDEIFPDEQEKLRARVAEALSPSPAPRPSGHVGKESALLIPGLGAPRSPRRSMGGRLALQRLALGAAILTVAAAALTSASPRRPRLEGRNGSTTPDEKPSEPAVLAGSPDAVGRELAPLAPPEPHPPGEADAPSPSLSPSSQARSSHSPRGTSTPSRPPSVARPKPPSSIRKLPDVDPTPF